ncbi:MAG: hypothetical protein WBG92_19710 [Thiohalocapsa sp.]
MELSEAIRQLIPLQVCIPNPRQPLELVPHFAAEVFVVETARSRAVVWLDAFWCEQSDAAVCHIAYADPRRQNDADRWVDNDPRFGPKCLAYQKPVILERLDPRSSAWTVFRSWQSWRTVKGGACSRREAWKRAKQDFAEIAESPIF